MAWIKHYSFMLVLLFGVLVSGQVAAAQSQGVDALNSQYATLKEEALSVEPEDPKLADILLKVETAISDIANANAKEEEQAAMLANLDASLTQIEQTRAQLEADYPLPDDSVSVQSLRNTLTQYQQEQRALAVKVTELQNRLSDKRLRSQAISEEIITVREQLSKSQSDSVAPRSDDLVGRATSLLQLVRTEKFRAQLQALQTELETLPARTRLLDQQTQLESARLTILNQRIAQISSELRYSNLREARQLKSSLEARLQSATNPLEVESLRETLALTDPLILVTQATYAEQLAIQTTDAEIASVEKSQQLFQRITAMERADTSLGQILRRVRNELPSTTALDREIAANHQAQLDLQYNMIIWRDELDSRMETGSEDSLKMVLTELLERASDYDVLLSQHETKLESLRATTDRLTRELNGRLLWLPTNEVINPSWAAQFHRGAQAYTSAKNWQTASRDFLIGFYENWLFSIALLVSGVGLLVYRRRLSGQLPGLAEQAGHRHKDTYLTTPIAILVSILIAAGVPLLLWTSGLLLSEADTSFSVSLAIALKGTASLWLIFSVFIVFAGRHGIFKGHFGWSDPAISAIRKSLKWLLIGLVPLTLIFVSAMASTIEDTIYGIGRPTFILISLLLSFCAYQILRPGSHVSDHIFGGMQFRFTERIAFVLFVVAPLLLAILSLLGYFDTAIILQTKLFESAVLLLFAALIFGLLSRLYAVSARRLSRQRALARLNARRSDEDQPQGISEAGVPVRANTLDNDLAAQAISEQSKTVIWLITMGVAIIGLFYIWRSVLPALGIANTIVLWTGVETIDGVPTASPISLADVLAALTIMGLGIYLARNIRGLLALGIAQKIEMRPGERYAASSIIAYIIFSAAFVLGLNKLGLDWSKLQWIVAALGVGLGFGLQEIVANFVSGLIILFERPVRVGDVVTIGTLDGTVTKISIRATTITDFDHREVIIPNKSIITENVSNWTLGDTVTRLLITIGIGYDDDIARARELMEEIVRSHPAVLEDPAPSVFFVKHSDSTLDFQIRAYVGGISDRLATQHELNEQFHNTLTQEGFDLSYPQRNVHLFTHDTPEKTPNQVPNFKEPTDESS